MRRFAFALGLVAAAGAAPAQTLKPMLQPGLWEEDVQVLINGRDLKALMRQAQAAMIAKAPADQRAQMEAVLRQQGEPTGRSLDCLGEKEVAEMADPARALAKSMREEPLCTAQVVSVGGNAFRFRSVCNDPDGFSGTFDGEYTVHDARRWTYSMTGRGTVAGGSADALGLDLSRDGTVELKNVGQARWVSAECGKVRP
jgi:hypothetical protein